MGFNLDGFRQSKLAKREEDVKVPALAKWFDDGEAPVFKVRGLSAVELARAEEKRVARSNMTAVLKAIAKPGTLESEKVDELRAAIGLTDEVPGETAKRLAMLEIGCIAPELSTADCVKLGENFPIEFHILTNKITELSGLGAEEAEKSKPSGETPESKPD